MNGDLLPQVPPHILIVEDDRGTAQLLASSLKNRGWKTTLVFTGAEAIAAIRRRESDFMVLDLRLPDLSAEDLLDRAAEENLPIPPFLVVTGYGDLTTAIALLRRGAFDYLIKNSQILTRVPQRLAEMITLHEARRRLQETNRRFEALFMNMSESVAIHELRYDAQGAPCDYLILDCNPPYTELTGIPRDMAVGAPASRLYGTGTAPYLTEYATVVATGQPVTFDTYFEPLDKHLAVTAIKTGENHFATIATDISDRVRLTRGMKQQADYYAAILEHLPAMLFVKDAETFCFTEVNRAAEEFFGIPRKDIVGLHIDDLLRPEEAREFEMLYRQAIAGRAATAPKDIPVTTLFGPRVMRTIQVPFFEKEKITHILGLALDVTNEKQTSKNLEEVTERLRAILNALPDFILLLDERRVFVDYFVNDPLLLFAPPERFLKRGVAEVFASPFREEFERAVTEAVERGSVQTVLYQEDVSGTMRHHEMRITAVNPRMALVLVRDVTERELLTEALAEENSASPSRSPNRCANCTRRKRPPNGQAAPRAFSSPT